MINSTTLVNPNRLALVILALTFSTLVHCQTPNDSINTVTKSDIYTPMANELKFFNSDSAIILYTQGISLNLTQGDTLKAVHSLISLSELHAHNAEFGLAYDRYWEALLLADKIDNDGARAAVYSGLGWLYSFYAREELAAEYFNKSLRLLKNQIKENFVDRQVLMNNYFALVTLYRKNKNIALSKQYVDSCRMIKLNSMQNQTPTFLDVEIAYLTYYEGKPEEALEILNRLKAHFEKQHFAYSVILYSFYGDIYKSLGSYDSSELYYKNAIQVGEKYKSHLDVVPGIYENIADLYQTIAKHDLAYEYLNKSKQLDERHFGSRSENNKHFIEIKDEFRVIKDNQNKKIREQRLAQLEHESKISYLQSVILIGTIFFLVLSGFLIYRYLRTKYKAEKRLLRKQQELEMEKANEILEIKNKELTFTALQVIEREELLGNVKSNIMSQKEKPDPNQLNRLVKSIELNTANNWKEFEMRFISVNKSFYQNLLKRFPSLTQSDQRLCALVKLNFSSKDMSRLLGISVESVHTTRYRLRKKLQLDKNANLSEFLSNV
ncbi:MAG: tetratricopeptide repeat protein [Cyclobacteriaceae bacterium]